MASVPEVRATIEGFVRPFDRSDKAGISVRQDLQHRLCVDLTYLADGGAPIGDDLGCRGEALPGPRVSLEDFCGRVGGPNNLGVESQHATRRLCRGLGVNAQSTGALGLA